MIALESEQNPKQERDRKLEAERWNHGFCALLACATYLHPLGFVGENLIEVQQYLRQQKDEELQPRTK